MTLYLIDDKTAPKSQRFRWQLKGRNGKIVAASSEGFYTARDCAENAHKTASGLSLMALGSLVHFKGRKPFRVRP